MAMNFVQALSDARRRAQLTGRPLSAQEVSGIASGYFQDAADRNDAARRTNIAQAGQTTAEKAQAAQESQFAQKLSDERDALAKSLALKEKELLQQGLQFGQNLETNKTQFGETLALNKERMAGEMSAADAARKQQLTGNVLQGAGTGALVYGYGKNAGMWGSPAAPPSGTVPGALAGSAPALIPVTQGSTLAPAAEIGTESAAAWNAGSGGGPTASGAAPVLAYIAAADMIRQDQGQLDRPYEERGANAKFASAPVTGGPAALLDIAGMGSDNDIIGSSANQLAKGEENLVGGPLDKAFSGNIGGSFTDFGEAVVNTPGRVANVVAEPVKKAVDDWVLCSELSRQGGLEKEILDEEWSYIRERITAEEYAGYRIMADPAVKLMQKSRTFTRIISPFIRAFAYEMASRVNRDREGNELGRVILGVGLPLCALIGRRGNVLNPVLP